jgi:hypothetical protein
MNRDVLEMCQQRFKSLAEQMEAETIACSTAEIQLEGKDYEVPALVVKGNTETRLRRPIVRCQILGIETSECPVIAVGVEFPHQIETLAACYWSWLPMHTGEQREWLRLMASVPAWLVVIFSGEVVSRALKVGVSELTRARYRQLKRVVESYPTNPGADADRAINAAQAATATVLGDGYELETVKDIGRDDFDSTE